jgi:hypothetical protein
MIIPRAVTYNATAKTLARTTEIWLVDQGNGASGPDTVRNQGLVIAFGFESGIGIGKLTVDGVKLTVCVRDKWETPCHPWITLDGTAKEATNFAAMLDGLLTNGPWKWKAWKLGPGEIAIPETNPPECEAVLVEYVAKNFKPKKARGFHVVPVAVSALNASLPDHYILGLAVYTQHEDPNKVFVVDDFMTMACAMKAPTRLQPLPPEPSCGAVACPVASPAASTGGGRRASRSRAAGRPTTGQRKARSRA